MVSGTWLSGGVELSLHAAVAALTTVCDRLRVPDAAACDRLVRARRSERRDLLGVEPMRSILRYLWMEPVAFVAPHRGQARADAPVSFAFETTDRWGGKRTLDE